MNNTVINSILDDAAKMEAADNLMTEAFAALDECDWDTAYDKAMATLGISQNVEQRLAAIMVRELASSMDCEAAAAILDEAYSTDDPSEATVEAYNADLLKANQAACAKLDEAVEELKASLERIRDRFAQAG